MAKVKIQGNASGTGVLTVTAPNTSTDRTITLPDSTDTLAVNSDVTNKLPLAGGTMSGNLIVNASVNAAGSGTGGGFHFADGNAMIYRDTNDMVFKLQGAEKIRLLSSGGISFNGDTASANALDDYEEGTWTPTVHDSTTEASEGQTYAHNDGYYTKIGNTVHCWGKLQITSLGTMNTNSGAHIHGLPFATSSNTYFRAVTVFGYGASLAQSTAASLSGYSLPSSNNIYVLNWDTNSGITTLTIGELSVNANLHWYTVYRV